MLFPVIYHKWQIMKLGLTTCLSIAFLVYVCVFIFPVQCTVASNCKLCIHSSPAVCTECPTAYVMVDTDFDNTTEACEGKWSDYFKPADPCIWLLSATRNSFRALTNFQIHHV
jgi:hypothetical protein